MLKPIWEFAIGKSQVLSSSSSDQLETGRDRKIMVDLYREWVVKNAIQHVIIEKP